jgi:hypothetical protein
MIDHDVRNERTTLVARTLTEKECAARDAKTTRLRQQRLEAETALSKPDDDDLKRTSAKKRRRVIHVR